MIFYILYTLSSTIISGVLLKMEVGIRKGGEGPEGTLLIYDH